jgi:hypothetical protein
LLTEQANAHRLRHFRPLRLSPALPRRAFPAYLKKANYQKKLSH